MMVDLRQTEKHTNEALRRSKLCKGRKIFAFLLQKK